MNSNAPFPKFSFSQRLKLKKIGISKWDIPTYTTANELIKLYKLSKQLKSNSICVEVGSYIGASSLMISKGIAKGSILYCIDTWENDAMTEGKWNSLEIFKDNTHSVVSKIKMMKSKSVDAAKDFNQEIDFIFIDGDHSYEGVKSDVDVWFPKLKSGGIIIMHDFAWAEGVIKVIADDVKPHLIKHSQLPNMFWGWKK